MATEVKIEAPVPANMSRFGLEPRPMTEEPGGHPCCNGLQAPLDHWKAEAEAERQVQQKTLNILVQKADALEELEKKHSELDVAHKITCEALDRTSIDLAGTALNLKETTAELHDTKDSLATCQKDLEEATALLKSTHEELEITRNDLTQKQRQAADTRWNLGAQTVKLQEFSKRMSYQSGLRKQVLARTIETKSRLIADMEAEREVQLIAAKSRLADVKTLKDDVASQIKEVQLLFGERLATLMDTLEEELVDAENDSKLVGGVLTGGDHPVRKRALEREAKEKAMAAEAEAKARAEAEEAEEMRLAKEALKEKREAKARAEAEEAEELRLAKEALKEKREAAQVEAERETMQVEATNEEASLATETAAEAEAAKESQERAVAATLVEDSVAAAVADAAKTESP